jgi:hypothetical protein
MIELREPIIKGFCRLDYEEAFSRICNYLKNYEITEDKRSGKITVEASYIYQLVFWSTWIKNIVILLERRSDNVTFIEIFGKPVLSPHHIFKIPYYRKNKINISDFKQEFINNFQIYGNKTLKRRKV